MYTKQTQSEFMNEYYKNNPGAYEARRLLKEESKGKVLRVSEETKEKQEKSRERILAYNKEYTSRPEVKERRKAYMKEYFERPDNKLKRDYYNKTYVQRPEVKERMKQNKIRKEQEKQSNG